MRPFGESKAKLESFDNIKSIILSTQVFELVQCQFEGFKFNRVRLFPTDIDDFVQNTMNYVNLVSHIVKCVVRIYINFPCEESAASPHF